MSDRHWCFWSRYPKGLIIVPNLPLSLSAHRHIQLTEEIKQKIDSSQKVAKKLERFSKKPNGQTKDDAASNSDSGDEHNESNEFNSINSIQSHDTFGPESSEPISEKRPSEAISEKAPNETEKKPFEEMSDKSLIEQLNSLEMNSGYFQKLRQLDEKLNGISADCLCYCHKLKPAESSTQSSKYLNGYTNGTSTCSTASIQTQTSTETDSFHSLDLDHEKLPVYPMNGKTNGHSNGHSNGYSNGTLATYRSSSVEKADFSTQTLSTGDIVITKVYFEENVAH